MRPHENRFEADELAAELARHGLHGTGRVKRHLSGMVFVGAEDQTATSLQRGENALHGVDLLLLGGDIDRAIATAGGY